MKNVKGSASGKFNAHNKLEIVSRAILPVALALAGGCFFFGAAQIEKNPGPSIEFKKHELVNRLATGDVHQQQDNDSIHVNRSIHDPVIEHDAPGLVRDDIQGSKTAGGIFGLLALWGAASAINYARKAGNGDRDNSRPAPPRPMSC